MNFNKKLPNTSETKEYPNLPPPWSQESKYDIQLCAESMRFITNHLNEIFTSRSSDTPLRPQDTVNCILECISSVLLAL